MRKLISLSFLTGLLAMLFLVVITSAHASMSSSNSQISKGDRTESEQAGPPWYDEGWHYRKPIVITNNGAALAYYQILIKMDNSNFNFSRAKTDGSDVRFTHSDGTTELRNWIESWDNANHLAYIWVRVPALATGNTTIYIYYNNPQAFAVSSGTTTFDGFDDNWSQFAGAGFTQEEEPRNYQLPGDIYSPFTWSIISGSPDATSGFLSLADGDGIKSTSTYLNNAMGMRAKFSSGNGYEWGGFINGTSGNRSMIGDLPSDASNLFLIDSRDGLETDLLPRIGVDDWHNNYHIYEVRWNLTQCKGDIDHGISTATSTQPAQVPNSRLPVTLYSFTGSNAIFMVDWVYVRQYRDPEPTTSIGSEQGLVKLSINNIDSPDPIRTGRRLTYQITVSNTSVISAPGVVMTDTLPANVQLGPISTSQGICTPGSLILCDLNTINANSTAWVTIIVTPTVDGQITNITAVGSPGFELDLSDNISEQVTLVDSVPPVVNWERPVHSGDPPYFSSGGLVTLEASAIDTGQVAWVEFKLWDHDPLHTGTPHWIIIGRDYSYPYQVQFDINSLVVDEAYQTFVYAADRAGNQSDPYNPLQRIFLGRKIALFLPMIRK